jgi:membrane protein
MAHSRIGRFDLLRKLGHVLAFAGVLLRETVESWQADDASQMAAALAFYTTFSLAPALLIGLAVASAFVGTEAAHAQLVAELNELLGAKGADFVMQVVETSRGQMTGKTATAIGLVAALFGATVAFAELHYAFNRIWKVQLSRRGFIMRLIHARALSFLVVICIGALLIVFAGLSAALSILDQFFTDALPYTAWTLHWLDSGASFLLMTLLLAVLFKLIPDTTVQWGDVWVGAVVTSILFVIGKVLMGIYLGTSSLSSFYGAAGSLVVILLWVYYSAQVLFFGAELTFVHAQHRRQPPYDSP